MRWPLIEVGRYAFVGRCAQWHEKQPHCIHHNSRPNSANGKLPQPKAIEYILPSDEFTILLFNDPRQALTFGIGMFWRFKRTRSLSSVDDMDKGQIAL
jgi:hypothetical protein